MMSLEVDLFVIGAGSGGTRAARIAAGHGARVMVAEEFRIGGTCVIRGCVPKKLMVYASRFADEFEDAAGFGWTVEKPVFDWQKLVNSKEAEITRLSGLYRTNLAKAGVAIVESRAVVEGAHHVRLQATDQIIRARQILVATGATPYVDLVIPGQELAISSNEVFDLPVFPKRLAIVGGGYIAVEFASLFARLGSQVTLMLRGDNVLRGFDEDMREGLREALEAAGITLRFGILPIAIERQYDHLHVRTSHGEPVEVDQIMVATGRIPNTRGLGLEAAGVVMDKAGAIVVDGYSATNIASIHAVGDVTNRLNLTPVAIREGHAFADNVFGGKNINVDHFNVATGVFTTPEIGTVGLTEAQACASHAVVDIYLAKFRPMRATLSGRAEKTIMKIVVDAGSDKVLGVHILGHEAGEMAQLLGIAVKMGATKADFDATMAVHPTAAEELVTMRTRMRRIETPRF